MNNLPGFITRNFRLKLGCALLAVITWTGVVYAGNPPATRLQSVAVPQAPSSIPTGFVLIHKIADVPLRLGGTRDSLDAFDASSLTIKVDWKAVKHGGVQPIPISFVNNDPRVELLDAPTSVEANLDTEGSVTVPVTITIAGNPPAGILLGAQSSSPATVTAVGPSHELKGLLARVSVDLSVQRANFQAVVSVYPFDARGNKLADVSLTPGSVTVSIALMSSVTSRVVAVHPIISGKVALGYALSFTYSPQSVTISGPQDLLNTIDSVNTSTISINGLTGNVTLNETLQLPDGVSASSGVVSVTLLVTAVTPATPTPSPTPSPTTP